MVNYFGGVLRLPLLPFGPRAFNSSVLASCIRVVALECLPSVVLDSLSKVPEVLGNRVIAWHVSVYFSLFRPLSALQLI